MNKLPLFEPADSVTVGDKIHVSERRMDEPIHDKEGFTYVGFRARVIETEGDYVATKVEWCNAHTNSPKRNSEVTLSRDKIMNEPQFSVEAAD